MSSHVYEVKNVSLTIGLYLVSEYQRLKKVGLSNLDAKGWAIYRSEDARQGGFGSKAFPGPRATAQKDPKYRKGFDHAIRACFGKPIKTTRQ